jgi:hypothetical protein
VWVKGVLVPFLIVQLYGYRHSLPLLSTLGMAVVTFALTAAVAQWLYWIAGMLRGAAHVQP